MMRVEADCFTVWGLVVVTIMLDCHIVIGSPANMECGISADSFCVSAVSPKLVHTQTPMFILAQDTDVEQFCSTFSEYESCRSMYTSLCTQAVDGLLTSHRMAYTFVCSEQARTGYTTYSAVFRDPVLQDEVDLCYDSYQKVYQATEARRPDFRGQQAIVKLNTSLCSTTERYLACVRDWVAYHGDIAAGQWQYTIQQYLVDAHYHQICGDLIDTVYVRKDYNDGINLSSDQRPRVIGAGILGIALLTASVLLIVRYGDKIPALYRKCRRRTQRSHRNQYRPDANHSNQETDDEDEDDFDRTMSVYTISTQVGSADPVYMFRTEDTTDGDTTDQVPSTSAQSTSVMLDHQGEEVGV